MLNNLCYFLNYFMHFYLLGLGSNIDPEIYLPEACAELSAVGDIIDKSPALPTQKVGATFNGEFMNQLIVLASESEPDHLKQQLLSIESRLGREKKTPERQFRDRTIDIDILLCATTAEECRGAPLEESYYRCIQQQWRLQEKV